MSEGAASDSASTFSYVFRILFFAPIFAVEWAGAIWLVAQMYREVVEALAKAREKRRRE